MEGIIFIDGSFYKLGVKGKVFRQVNGGWVLSSKTPRQLKNALRYNENEHKSLNKRLKA